MFPPLQIYSYTFEVLQTVGFDDDHIPALSLGISLSELLSAVFCVSEGSSKEPLPLEPQAWGRGEPGPPGLSIWPSGIGMLQGIALWGN